MENITKILSVDLQLFADGAAGTGGDGGNAAGTGVTAAAAVPQGKGVKSNPLASVKYGIQSDEPATAEPETEAKPAAAPTPEARQAAFDQLIRGEYKDLYDAKVQAIVRDRLKSRNETVEKYEALTPTLQMLADKYGVDVSDVKALNKAIEDDDAFYEAEAEEKGITVQQLKEIRRMERENKALKEEMRAKQSQDEANQRYAAWMQQADGLKAVYPTFDLNAEVENPQFRQLLRSGIDVRTAYEVIHKDEIIPAAMQFTAKTVEQKIANKIASGGSRPAENGMANQGAATVKSDVSKLTRADRDEIIRRVQRGEKIRF